MKIKSLLAIALVATLAGCGVNTSDNIDLDASDIRYIKDSETGLCFAFVASRKALSASTSGLGFTEVPCSKEVLEKVE